MRIILAFLFSVSTFSATGSWNGVAFTAWNGAAITSWNGTSISCASAGITFGTQVATYTDAASALSSGTIAMTAGVSVGEMAVLYIAQSADGGTTPGMIVSTVTDARGNTWTVVAGSTDGQYYGSAIAYSYVTTALQIADVVTVNYANTASTTTRFGRMFKGAGLSATQPDVAAVHKADTFIGDGGSPSISITTSSAATLVLCALVTDRDVAYAVGGGFTQLADDYSVGASRELFMLYRITTSAAAYNPSGTFTIGGGTGYRGEAVALK